MPNENKPKKKLKAAKIVCPNCGSLNAQRVRRSLFEKILCVFTFNHLAYSKFYCKLCDQYILKSQAQTIADEQYRDENALPLEDYSDY